MSNMVDFNSECPDCCLLVERIQQLTEDHEKDRKFWLSGVNHLKEEHQTEVSKLEQRIQQLETALNEFARATSFNRDLLCL